MRSWRSKRVDSDSEPFLSITFLYRSKGITAFRFSAIDKPEILQAMDIIPRLVDDAQHDQVSENDSKDLTQTMQRLQVRRPLDSG
jgi:hypothetical protein